MSGPYVLASSAVKSYQDESEKLGWFDRWFKRKIDKVSDRGRIVAAHPAESFNGDNGLNMTVYGADGGYIVSFNKWDIKADRNRQSLHIITNDENFAERLSEIVTLELIKSGMNQ